MEVEEEWLLCTILHSFGIPHSLIISMKVLSEGVWIWWAGLETEHDKHGNLDSDEARQAAARGKRNHLNEVL